MRWMAWLLLACPSEALAWSSERASVTVGGEEDLFLGSDVDTGYWPADSPLQVRFAADLNASMVYSLSLDSELSWPEALQHELLGVARGGLVALSASVELLAEVHYDLFGFNDTLEVWSDALSWSGSSPFDTPLMPGALTEQVQLRADGEVGGLDVELPLLGGLALSMGGEVVPSIEVELSGLAVVANGVRRESAGGWIQLDPPTINRGIYDIELWWEGLVSARGSLLFVPWLSVCLDADCYEVASFELGSELVHEGIDLVSEPGRLQHPLPALEPGQNTLDLGVATVGEEVEGRLDLHNLGGVPVEGEISLIGEGFELYQDRFYATESEPGPVLLDFAAEEAGSYTGTLTLWSNDPVEPVQSVPVAITVEEQPPVEATPLGEGGRGAVRQCSCAAASGSGGLGLLLVAALAAARLRRSVAALPRRG